MSMFMAVFATVFVCGNIVNGSVSSDSYRQPIPKTNYDISYSDTSISDEYNEIAVSASDSRRTSEPVTHFEGNVTVVEFFDDEEDEATSETVDMPEEDVDEMFLYMTTVTTTGLVTEQQTTTTTALRTTQKKTAKTAKTAKTTRATTKRAAYTAATTAARFPRRTRSGARTCPMPNSRR